MYNLAKIIVGSFFILVGALILGMYLALSSELVLEEEVTIDINAARAAECAELYDVGKHKEWAACMGVPYR